MGKLYRLSDPEQFREWAEAQVGRPLTQEEEAKYLGSGSPMLVTSHDLVDFLKMKYPPTPSLVGNRLVIPGGFTLMGTWPKVGKSHLAMQLAINRASGEPWLGFPTTKGRSLYINCEIISPMFQERFQDLLDDRKKPQRDSVYLATLRGRRTYINTLEGRQFIEALIEQRKPDLLILDPLSKLMEGNESDPVVMQAFLQVISEWQVKYGVAIMLIHHFRKKPRDLKGKDADASIDEFSGSSLLTRDTDSIIVLDGTPGNNKITMRFALRHAEGPAPFVIKRGDDLWWRRIKGLVVPKLYHAALGLLLDAPLPRSKWIEAIGDIEQKSRKTSERRVRDSLEKGYVQEQGGNIILTGDARSTLE